MREAKVEVRYVDVPVFLKSNPKCNIFKMDMESGKFVKIKYEDVANEKRLCYIFEKDNDIPVAETKSMDKIIIVK